MRGFHHHISRWITGKSVWGIGAQLWEYLIVDEALEATGLWPIQEYSRCFQAKLYDYIIKRLIYELCTGVECLQGSIQLMHW